MIVVVIEMKLRIWFDMHTRTDFMHVIFPLYLALIGLVATAVIAIKKHRN